MRGYRPLWVSTSWTSAVDSQSVAGIWVTWSTSTNQSVHFLHVSSQITSSHPPVTAATAVNTTGGALCSQSNSRRKYHYPVSLSLIENNPAQVQIPCTKKFKYIINECDDKATHKGNLLAHLKSIYESVKYNEDIIINHRTAQDIRKIWER